MDKFERARLLLEITERTALHSGKLAALSNAAMSELLLLNEMIRNEAAAKAEDDEAQRQAAIEQYNAERNKLAEDTANESQPKRRL